MLLTAACGNAIVRNGQLEIPHIGIVSRAEYAAIGRNSREDQAFRSEMLQQQFQWSLIEGRVLRLQDEVVVLIGKKQIYKRASTGTGSTAPLDDCFEIGSPLAEIIVYIDARNLGGTGPFLQGSDLRPDTPRMYEKLLAAWEFEVVDHIDEKQTAVVSVWGAPMQIVLCSR